MKNPSTHHKLSAVLSGIRSDSHTWSIRAIQLFLEEHGVEVHNLGANTDPSELVYAILNKNPDMLVISSVNGLAGIEALQLAQILDQHKLHVPRVIGGILATNQEDEKTADANLTRAGFIVLTGKNAIPEFSVLIRDLAASKQSIPAGRAAQ